jgi:hypothetical protein
MDQGGRSGIGQAIFVGSLATSSAAGLNLNGRNMPCRRPNV